MTPTSVKGSRMLLVLPWWPLLLVNFFVEAVTVGVRSHCSDEECTEGGVVWCFITGKVERGSVRLLAFSSFGH